MNPVADMRVLVMAGGTGGHVFPALAVAEQLRDQGARITWLGTRAGIEARLVEARGFPIRFISVKGLRGKGRLSLLLAPFRLLQALLQSLSVVRQVRPACVLGMGGFASGPGGLAAWLCRKPLIIHEQNAVAGMTNRWLAPLARRVLSAFPGAFGDRSGVIEVGNPLRSSLLQQSVRERNGQIQRLLVFGGSLGAQALNRVVPQALKLLDQPLEVRHQSGERTYDTARDAYAQAGIKAEIVTFIDDMAAAYDWADLVIARSGALSVSEIACAGVPSLLVPYTHAVDDHQTANAHWLVDAGAALLIPEAELTAEQLAALLADLIQAPERVRAMGQHARQQARLDATQQVAQHCVEVACV